MRYELKSRKKYDAEEDWLEFCEYLISKRNREGSTIKLCENSLDTPYITGEEEVHNKYDKGYKYLLSVKKNFIDFVKTFMKISWNEEIEEKDITLLDKEFITVDFDKRESDLIYEINLKNEKAYFILIEIQSSVDRKMAYRLLNYMVEIWRKWESSRVKGEKFILPKIIPCVLYTGENKWTAPIEFKDLYEEISNEEDYLINFKYILIDINRYKSEDLLEVGNVISSAFYLETSRKEDMEERLINLAKSLTYADEDSIKEFKRWTENVFKLSENAKKIIEEKFNKEEEAEMSNIPRILDEIWEDAFEEGIEEGRKEGIARGIEQGIKEGKMALIKRILIKKLNKLPPTKVISQLERLTTEELEDIEERIFEINSWEEI